MFYDPKWTPLTLDHLIGWLETKPSDEIYDGMIPKYCLFGQYYREYGFDYVICLSEIEKQLGLPQYSAHEIVLDHEKFGDALVKFKELKCRIEEMNSPAKQS